MKEGLYKRGFRFSGLGFIYVDPALTCFSIKGHEKRAKTDDTYSLADWIVLELPLQSKP